MSVLSANAPPIPEHDSVPVLYLSEIERGWWPGTPRNCHHCNGRLHLIPPTADAPGYLADMQCGREVAEVRATRRPAFVPSAEDYASPKRGRPQTRPGDPKPRPTTPCVTPECPSLVQRNSSKSGRCFPCSVMARKAKGWRGWGK